MSAGNVEAAGLQSDCPLREGQEMTAEEAAAVDDEVGYYHCCCRANSHHMLPSVFIAHLSCCISAAAVASSV